MERDLFGPIKAYFEEQGYVCDGEVKDIDLFMQKDGHSVAVELKQKLDFRSIQQAALRQKIVWLPIGRRVVLRSLIRHRKTGRSTIFSPVPVFLASIYQIGMES